jgi:hypothetical protein
LRAFLYAFSFISNLSIERRQVESDHTHEPTGLVEARYCTQHAQVRAEIGHDDSRSVTTYNVVVISVQNMRREAILMMILCVINESKSVAVLPMLRTYYQHAQVVVRTTGCGITLGDDAPTWTDPLKYPRHFVVIDFPMIQRIISRFLNRVASRMLSVRKGCNRSTVLGKITRRCLNKILGEHCRSITKLRSVLCKWG